MTQTIEQLRARIAELEEEKKELQALLDFDNARLDQIEDELEDVEYLGPFVEGIKVLKTQLAAAQEQQQTTFLQLSHALRITEEKLAKAEQLWQLAQGRCDALEEKLAKAEQRVAEWQPIETAPKDGQSYLAYSTEFVNQYWVTDKCNGMTHWMPLPKAPANGGNS